MSKIKTALAVCALLVGANAYAATGGTTISSEQFFQSGPGNHIVTPGFEYSTQTVKPDAGDDQNESGPALTVNYEYGINDMMSVGGEVGYASTTDDSGASDTTASGMTDFTFTLKGQNAFVEGSSFHWGADFAMSPGNKTIENNGDSNAQSGGMTLTPFAGYQWLMGSHVIGARANLDIFKSTHKTEQGGDTYETTGGNLTTLMGFYEIPADQWLWGFDLSYSTIGSDETELDGTVVSEGDSMSFVRVGTYPTWKMSETATVIGRLGYTTLVSDLDGVDGVNSIDFQVAGRFAF